MALNGETGAILWDRPTPARRRTRTYTPPARLTETSGFTVAAAQNVEIQLERRVIAEALVPHVVQILASDDAHLA